MKKERIISLALAVLMLLGLCTGCEKKDESAEEIIPEESYAPKEYELKEVEVSKDETVYVNLNADGSLSKVNVSDHLHSAEPLVRIRDASDLSDISDIKTFTEPTKKDGQLLWDMESTDLYYNGVSKKAPPLSVDIKYYLDGKPISPKRIAGKSGKVDIEISIINNIKKENSSTGYDIYCPMIMAGGILLPDEGFENVSVRNGTVIGDGSHEIVLLLGIPGMDESLGVSSLGLPLISSQLCKTSYTISADVKDFSIGNIMFTAVPFSSVAALSNKNMSEDISGINQVLTDLQSIMTAMASQSVDSVMDMLYGDVTQTEKLINAISSAADVYERNKPLIDYLVNIMSDENIEAIGRLAEDIEGLDISKAQSGISASLAELNKILAELSGNLIDLSQFASDLKEVLPVLQNLEVSLSTDEMQEIREKLPESLEQIKQLRDTLQDSEELMNKLSAVSGSDFANQMQIILETATKYTKGSMSKAQEQNLAGRIREWLLFGQTYDIFTDKAEGTPSSVMFIYKTAAIG